MSKTKGFASKLPKMIDSELRRAKKPRRAALGAMKGSTGGRADKLPVRAPRGSFVIPSDVVGALGDGNSMSGMEKLTGQFPKSSAKAGKMADGGVPIKVSDGEFIVSPEDVAAIGGGDMDHGHNVLDAFVRHTRAQTIDHLKSLPNPRR